MAKELNRRMGRDTKHAAEAAVGTTLGGAEKQNYTWAKPRRKVIVQNAVGSGINIGVRFNADDAGAGVWDVLLQPGDFVVSPDGILIDNVSIYGTDAGTYGTNYSIKGWD